ncbi:MAG: LysR family transcriptional regulator [Vicinamibacterales bacterium]
MTFEDLRVFAAVAGERSFSRAAHKLGRTQPAVSQAIRRLEDEAGERLIDRSARDGTLTDAGDVLLGYATRLLRLADEAGAAVSDLRSVRAGRVVIGANEGGVHAVLPHIAAFSAVHPSVHVEVRRVHARGLSQELLLRAVDFGVFTFAPDARELQSILIGTDELVLLVAPSHPLAGRTHVTMEEMGRQTVIAHNDPSPAREHVLRQYERRHALLNIRMSLPSLDGIKRAVEMGLGVALLPRRCAQTEIARGQLLAIQVPELRAPRQLRLVHRRGAALSHAARAFLDIVRAEQGGAGDADGTAEAADVRWPDTPGVRTPSDTAGGRARAPRRRTARGAGPSRPTGR